MYLSDVDEESGPFSVVPKSHHTGKKLRHIDNSKNRFGRMFGNHGICGNYLIPQNDHPDYKYKLTALTGKIGTLIIFDSDILHQDGVLRTENSA